MYKLHTAAFTQCILLLSLQNVGHGKTSSNFLAHEIASKYIIAHIIS